MILLHLKQLVYLSTFQLLEKLLLTVAQLTPHLEQYHHLNLCIYTTTMA